MASLLKSKFYIAAGIIFLIIFIDHLTKSLFVSNCNSGLAFGMFRSAKYLSLLVPVLVILAFAFYFLKQTKKTNIISASLVIGGGLSNTLDRLVFGCVRDFIDFKIWPSFNIADIAISVGVAVIVIMVISRKRKSSDLNH